MHFETKNTNTKLLIYNRLQRSSKNSLLSRNRCIFRLTLFSFNHKDISSKHEMEAGACDSIRTVGQAASPSRPGRQNKVGASR